MKNIGYGIVGTGYFGAELGRIMKEQEGAHIAAVLDPENAVSVAQELGCGVETDLDALCARPDVDALIVATPNYLHKEPVLAAARHKKHVFCEKPIALSYADCDEMVKACQESGVTFMAGHVMNFFRGVRHAKRLIAEGKIGRVLYCHSARNGWEEPQPSISWKKIREKSGGHLYHHIHELDCTDHEEKSMRKRFHYNSFCVLQKVEVLDYKSSTHAVKTVTEGSDFAEFID